MYRVVALLLSLTPAATPYAAATQAAADTLPERVVAQAYDAFNRADAAAFFSFFAPTWYHSVMEDTVAGPSRRVRDDSSRDLTQHWATGGTKPTLKVVHRLVLGPYVVDEQVREPGGTLHLDIFEVRKGKIVHEWESGPSGKTRSPRSPERRLTRACSRRAAGARGAARAVPSDGAPKEA